MWVHLACEPLSKQIHENEKNVDNVSHTVVSQSAVTFHAQKKSRGILSFYHNISSSSEVACLVERS
jgi:hypothetical protein